MARMVNTLFLFVCDIYCTNMRLNEVNERLEIYDSRIIGHFGDIVFPDSCTDN